MSTAGLPPTMRSGGTSLVTTEPAITTAPCPRCTPGMTMAPANTTAWSSMRTGRALVANDGSCTSWPMV
jgi:hypothetical protein